MRQLMQGELVAEQQDIGPLSVIPTDLGIQVSTVEILGGGKVTDRECQVEDALHHCVFIQKADGSATGCATVRYAGTHPKMPSSPAGEPVAPSKWLESVWTAPARRSASRSPTPSHDRDQCVSSGPDSPRCSAASAADPPTTDR